MTINCHNCLRCFRVNHNIFSITNFSTSKSTTWLEFCIYFHAIQNFTHLFKISILYLFLGILVRNILQMKPLSGGHTIIKRHLEISTKTPRLRSFPYSWSPIHILLPRKAPPGPDPPPTPTIVLIPNEGNSGWFSRPNAGRKEAQRDSNNFSSANTT